MESDTENRSRPRFQGTVAPETAVILGRAQMALSIRQPGRVLDRIIASWANYGCPEDLGVDVSDIDMQAYSVNECAEAGSIATDFAPLLMLVISFVALLVLSGLVTGSNFLPIETWLQVVQNLVR